MNNEIVLRSMRGTGEPLQSPLVPGDHWSGKLNGQPNMMDDIVRACADMGVEHRPVDYFASIAPFGGMKMFHETYHDGWRKAELADGEGRPSIWIGYSFGALILGDLMAAGELANCIGLILLADPLRHQRQVDNQGVNPAYYGAAGARWIPNLTTPVYSYSAPDDPISALPATNGFRLLAQIVTGAPQKWNVGFIDMGATLGACQRYLGTPSIAGSPAKISRHVIYGIENMLGTKTTYTKAAATAAAKIITEHRSNA